MMLTKRAFVYGLLVWILPFILYISVASLQRTDVLFFKAIMEVGVVAVVSALALSYYSKAGNGSAMEGVKLAVIWIIFDIVLDYAAFMRGPNPLMPWMVYFKEVAFTYLVIPSITIGYGILANRLARIKQA